MSGARWGANHGTGQELEELEKEKSGQREGQTAVIWLRKQALWDRKHLTKCVTLGRRFASESLSLPTCKMELRMPLWENGCEDEMKCFKSGWPSLCTWRVFLRW